MRPEPFAGEARLGETTKRDFGISECYFARDIRSSTRSPIKGVSFKQASAEGLRMRVARTSRTSCVSHMRSDGSAFSYPFLSVDSLTRLEEVEDRPMQCA